MELVKAQVTGLVLTFSIYKFYLRLREFRNVLRRRAFLASRVGQPIPAFL